MAARAIWTGTVSFGMVSIPVRLYTATESHDVRFHLLHKKDHARLKNVRWCPIDEKAVPWEEVERGYEYAKGKYMPITEEDLDKLPVATVHTVDIANFVKLEEVDPIYYDKTYYLAPDENGVKAFTLLRRALEETGRAAVAKVAIRDKENLCLIRPYGEVLSLETMLYANEVRPADELVGAADGSVKVSPRELEMAVSLIENLSDSFDPEKYKDEFQAAVQKVIRAKVEGAPLPEAPVRRGAKVVDLMEALRASVEATRKKSATPARRRAAGDGRRRKTA
ncbi:MAG: Ku protein [Chloroflexi bacterium]|nr:MAG: Ku protein [Chloroflexota bacterium]TMG37246.1 MAG: Ku protein [Chloroflexota bacterium]